MPDPSTDTVDTPSADDIAAAQMRAQGVVKEVTPQGRDLANSLINQYQQGVVNNPDLSNLIAKYGVNADTAKQILMNARNVITSQPIDPQRYISASLQENYAPGSIAREWGDVAGGTWKAADAKRDQQLQALGIDQEINATDMPGIEAQLKGLLARQGLQEKMAQAALPGAMAPIQMQRTPASGQASTLQTALDMMEKTKGTPQFAAWKGLADKLSGTGELTTDDPNEIRTLGHIYATTGQLPPLGMGKNPLRQQILHAGTEDMQGVTPDQSTLFGAPGSLPKGWVMGPNGMAMRAGSAPPAASTLSPTAAGDASIANRQDYKAATSLITDYSRTTPNSAGGKILAANTAANHLHLFDQLVDANNNGDINAFNRIKNIWNSETGNPQVTNLQTAASIIGPEIIKSVSSAGMLAQDDREALLKQLAAAKSPDQLHGAANTLRNLMVERVAPLEQNYQSITKRTDFRTKYLQPEAQRILGAGDTTGATAAASAPPASLLKEGVHTTFKNGQGTWTLVNGQPQKVQ